MSWTGKYKLGAIARVRVGKCNLGTRTSKYKLRGRVGKYKLGIKASKYKLGARVDKYKLRARVGKYKFGARDAGHEIQRPVYSKKTIFLYKEFFFVDDGSY